MSRKHWSDLFLFAAATALILAVVLSNYGRMLAIFALPCCFIAGIMTRRRMVRGRRVHADDRRLRQYLMKK